MIELYTKILAVSSVATLAIFITILLIKNPKKAPQWFNASVVLALISSVIITFTTAVTLFNYVVGGAYTCG